MKMPFAILATLALAAPLSVAPAAAVVNSGVAQLERSVTFDTAFEPQYRGAGEYDGVMHLTLAPDGAINGWYRSADVGTIRTVVGGLDGDRVWLDLGNDSLADVQGTYDNGKIVASTFFDDQLYSFVATPTRS